ncbi:tyrosine-type recombinase/integrase [Salinibacillus xinjiangensis]|uniref:Tyrosine-type recombinase/integrase n=2 Tax=Salinibacillus xinjiangensis TaxID=1229268 RepID=A0A6G1X3Z3_9BACI|nr:tyrosine-type recombinase/integrase [Salinibacillus xinjiangensis]
MPIREFESIKKMKDYLYQQSLRNGFLFTFGINSGLKISDILPLKVKDIKYASHLEIHDRNGNIRRVKISPSLKQEVEEYTKGKDDSFYLFPSREGNKPISRVTAWNILKQAAKEIGLSESIGTNTLRKTFGYHYYKKTKDLATLQQIFGHSSISITMNFIEIKEDLSDQNIEDLFL